MRSCVYRVVFAKSSFDLNDDYEYLSDIDKERISSLDAESYFDYNDNDHYVCIVITSPIEMEKYQDILNTNLIENECTNLSENILNSKINLKESLKDNISTLDSIKWGFFIDDLDEWIINNLDIDTVLDRISEVGMNSLTDIENEFLKGYNK